MIELHRFVLPLILMITRYCFRAKNIFSELKEKPHVVELDLRGNTSRNVCVLCSIVLFFFLLSVWGWICRRWISNSKHSPWSDWSTNCPSSIYLWQAHRWFWWSLSHLCVELHLWWLNSEHESNRGLFFCFSSDVAAAYKSGKLQKLLDDSWWESKNENQK